MPEHGVSVDLTVAPSGGVQIPACAPRVTVEAGYSRIVAALEGGDANALTVTWSQRAPPSDQPKSGRVGQPNSRVPT